VILNDVQRLLEALQRMEKMPAFKKYSLHSKLFHYHVQIGNYRELENFSEAYASTQRVLLWAADSIQVNPKPEIISLVIKLYILQADVALKSGNFSNAEVALEKALVLCQTEEQRFLYSLLDLYLNYGFLYYEMGLYEEAFKATEMGLIHIRKASFASNYLRWTYIVPLLSLKAEALNWQKRPLESIPYFQATLAMMDSVTPGDKRFFSTGDYHLKIADAYSALTLGPYAPRQDHSAYYHYQKALYHYSISFDPDKDEAIVPDFSDFSRNSRMLRICLNNFSKVLLRIARRTGQAHDWQNIYTAHRLAITSLEETRNRVSPDSRRTMTRLGRRTYEQAIASAFEMAAAQLGADSMYAIAFQWAEAAKAFELRMHLQDAEVALQTNAPDSLIRLGRRLKLARNYYENSFQSLRRTLGASPTSTADSLKLITLEKQLYEARAALRNWENTMQDQIPTSLKQSEPEVLSITDIQVKLKPHEAMLSFFCGDSAVYAFWIDPQRLEAVEVGKTSEVNAHVRRLLDELYQPGDIRRFVIPARELYTQLIEPFSTEKEPTDLLICPDGLLGYVPFACLLTEDIPFVNLSASYALRELPYLQAIQSQRYAYGANLHFGTSEKKGAPSSLVAFAPHYEAELDLAFNSPQAEAVASLWKGRLFPNEKAEERRFRKLLENYNILHLAQHGEANLEQPLASRLRFSETGDSLPENDGLLHAYEIYALNIPAQMVVLSSCESGYGPLAQGEGVMSLARAFRSAGAGSVLNTAWEVDGRVALPLMKDFYRKLSQGETKSEALVRASRAFLAEAPPELLHPHYWAAFTLIGEDEPLRPPTQYWIWYVFCAVMVAAFAYAMSSDRVG
jgi:CHAT domain-containing protein/tetratricopeptide (TPR) repeat protein